eukprot:3414777-Prymnesium_polylepis.1
MYARNACAAHREAVAMSHGATHRHQALLHTPWGVGQVWWTFQAVIATGWSSLLCEYSQIAKCAIREFEYIRARFA